MRKQKHKPFFLDFRIRSIYLNVKFTKSVRQTKYEFSTIYLLQLVWFYHDLSQIIQKPATIYTDYVFEFSRFICNHLGRAQAVEAGLLECSLQSVLKSTPDICCDF